MTVYSRTTRNGSKLWRYDFSLDGKRYTSPAALASRADAVKAEKDRRKRALRGEDDPAPGAAGSSSPAAVKRGGRVSLEAAVERYWLDVGQHLRSASDVRRRLDIVLRIVGGKVDAATISTATIIAAVQTRRAEKTRRGKPLTPGCVNRDTIDTLRPVLNHASDVFEIGLAKIAWKKARLKQADDVVREYSDAEIAAWARELGDVERVFLGFALTYGPRLGECFFPPDALRLDAPGGPEVELGRYVGRGGVERESRKDGSLHVVTLLEADAATLGRLATEARAAGCATIWTEEKKGERRSISYYAMRHRLVAAAERAGIKPGRIIHGARHHAGTQLMRSTGSLVLAQELLGHKQVTTTRRYAHASKSDLRAGLAKISTRIPAKSPPSGGGFAR